MIVTTETQDLSKMIIKDHLDGTEIKLRNKKYKLKGYITDICVNREHEFITSLTISLTDLSPSKKNKQK